jgi:alginate O-acetyltransferase complex protein AlgI
VLFHSQEFILLFLPLTIAAYYAVAANAALRQSALIACSIFFYAWWDVRFVPLLVGQVLATYALAAMSSEGKRAAPIVIGVLVNLGAIFTFKYLGFFLANIRAIGLPAPSVEIILPIGISFFSFQLISYLLDLRRGAAPLYPLRQFALVVLLFPHLIAGPIVRHRELVPQFDLDPRREGLARRLTLGALLFSIGLVQKVLLAEPMALIVDPIFVKAQTAALSFGEAWTAALGFSFQLLFDFSGYSTMAIGIALMLGLTFPENFNRPYLATNLRDFWRRWHMTLSAFLRDYVYIPLGGNRHGAAVFTFATLATMTLCGVWHGAAWTFIAWGGLHGAGMVVCRAWQTLQRPLPAAIGWALTMGFVLIGWVLFRAPSFGVAADMLKIMAGSNGFGGRLEGCALMLLSAVVCAALPPTHAIVDGARPSALLGAASALATLACVLIVGEGAPTKFIYFQF